eukprot:7619791-Pyramimonas_sp.AAC.1
MRIFHAPVGPLVGSRLGPVVTAAQEGIVASHAAANHPDGATLRIQLRWANERGCVPRAACATCASIY